MTCEEEELTYDCDGVGAVDVYLLDTFKITRHVRRRKLIYDCDGVGAVDVYLLYLQDYACRV